MSNRFFTVIMAGGAGTRFWPKSRRSRPKQVLPFLGGDSLLRRTWLRLEPAVAAEDVLVVTGADQLDIVRAELPELPETSFLAEPVGRNTAPCIALAALVCRHRAGDLPMLVIPADHFISDGKTWLDIMSAGAALAALGDDRTVVFGVRPSAPETGYGYIKLGRAITDKPYQVNEVEGFSEKPDLATARAYLDRGGYLWNSGCFAWMPSSYLNLIGRFMPGFNPLVESFQHALDHGLESFTRLVEERYHEAPDDSVDFAIIEHCDDIVAYSLDVGWSDVGSWSSLYEICDKNPDGNVVLGGEAVFLDSRANLVWIEDKLTALVGIDNLVVVQSEGVILVCPRSKAQKVKDVVRILKERGKPGSAPL